MVKFGFTTRFLSGLVEFIEVKVALILLLNLKSYHSFIAELLFLTI